jgi:hypothetical protein
MRQYCPMERPARQTAERLILASLWKSGLQPREICTAVETGVGARSQAAFLSSARPLCARQFTACASPSAATPPWLPSRSALRTRFAQPAIRLAIEA